MIDVRSVLLNTLFLLGCVPSVCGAYAVQVHNNSREPFGFQVQSCFGGYLEPGETQASECDFISVITIRNDIGEKEAEWIAGTQGEGLLKSDTDVFVRGGNGLRVEIKLAPSPKMPTELYLASARGDLRGVNDILLSSNGKSRVNEANMAGWTPLMAAARGGYVNVAQDLLDAGAHVNQADSDRNTALMYAAKKNHPQTLTMLIDSQANINAQNKFGQTALMFAAWGGHKDIVKLLLEAGADFNKVDRFRYSALDRAISLDHQSCAELLVRAGARTPTMWEKIKSEFAQLPSHGKAAWKQIKKRMSGFYHCLKTGGEVCSDAK